MSNIKPIEFPQVKIVDKVWGREEWLVNNDDFCGKKLIFNEGTKLSLHMHHEKHELFYLESGKLIFRYHDYNEVLLKERLMLPGDMVYIPQCNFHSVEALVDSVIIEISSHHEDSDSYRLTRSSQK